jgi:DNA-binding MarR family transcriptional regulator
VATLTPDGREAFDRARTTHLAAVRALFLDRCSDDELAALAEIWERILPGSTT